MTDQNLLYQIGITLVKGIGNITARQILEHLHDPSALFSEKKRILEKIPGLTARIYEEIHKPQVLRRAEEEIAFIERKRVKTLFIDSPDYPQRMRDCVDAPVMLYYSGNADLNAQKIISVVGTRRATQYGKQMTDKLVHDIAEQLPDTLIVSGLAFGIDVAAHRACIREGLPTVGVLAHGLDRIYPSDHRELAATMLKKGGLVTDFLSKTDPDKQNFVKRNRIIAGMADCTLVVESAAKGGALITANITDSYNRDLFAFSGKATDRYSEGCNILIKQQKAALITCAEDLIEEMNWGGASKKAVSQPVQKNIFLNLTEDEQRAVDLLTKTGQMQLNILAIEMDMPVSKLSNLLFELEMKGVVKCRPGGLYSIG